jgi:ADP-heptose:LPS heptosyltransferase
MIWKTLLQQEDKMKKILVISLKNEFDLIGTSFLINSYLKNNPHAEVSLLTYRDLKGAADLVANVSNVYSIDRYGIEHIFKNPLFSQGFAIDKFMSEIDGCRNQNWDEIINFSNDMVSSYLTTYFDTESRKGISISQTGTSVWNNCWEAYFNFYYGTQTRAPIHAHQIRHFMTEVPFNYDTNRLKINNEYLTIASQNFQRIRQSKSEGRTYVIGLSLQADASGNRVDPETMNNLIETMENSECYKPVLILSGTAEEKEIANQLNENFNNTLISISADYEAITSVLSNLDALVSTGNQHLYFADALDVKLIQIKESNDPLKTSSFVSPDNYMVIRRGEESCFNEVCYILNNEFDNELPVETIANQSKIYQSIQDSYSCYLTQIAGELDIQDELSYHVGRTYQLELMGFETNKELIVHLGKNTDPVELRKFMDFNKAELTECVKVLLSTLRSLKGMKQSTESRKNFVSYLDELMTFSGSESLISCPVTLFTGTVENIVAMDMEQNVKEIETALFELKADLQKLTNTFELLGSREMDSVQRESRL